MQGQRSIDLTVSLPWLQKFEDKITKQGKEGTDRCRFKSGVGAKRLCLIQGQLHQTEESQNTLQFNFGSLSMSRGSTT